MSEARQELVLYGYWRSSSAYRVRIALALKGLAFESRAVNLLRDGGEQHEAEYRRLNPLGLVPALLHGERVIVQSLAICEYLEEVFPRPALLPAEPAARARVRWLAQSIACEMQPLNNLSVLLYLKSSLAVDDEAVNAWYRHWIARGFSALESWLSSGDETGDYCHGNSPTLADCLLVPQVYNAERFDCDLGPYPEVRRVAANCSARDEFIVAAPENQPDAPR